MNAQAAPVTLRRARVEDAAAFARIASDPQVYPMLLQPPMTDEPYWRARLTEMCTPGRPDLHLVAERHGEVLGCAGLMPVSPSLRRRHAMHLGTSVAPQAWGQGVASALMQQMCEYADNWAQVLRIELEVYTDNSRAIGLYRKFGFLDEGVHRAYALRGGHYADVLMMSRLHPKQPLLTPAPQP